MVVISIKLTKPTTTIKLSLLYDIEMVKVIFLFKVGIRIKI